MSRKLVQILLVALIVSCSNEKKGGDLSSGDSVKEFNKLTIDEKAKLMSHLTDEFKGDFVIYSGATPDSLKILELVFDNDKRFALRSRETLINKTIKTDSSEYREFSFDNGIINKCFGLWTVDEQNIRLRFQLCTTDIFDSNKYSDLEIVDSNTALLDRNSKAIWVSGILLERR